jgi:hypothetical protein
MERSAQIFSTAAHASIFRSGFKAAEGGGPPSRLLGIYVIGGEALSCFLSKWPSRSRSLSIDGFPARLQKPLKGRGHKVHSLWFAQQPFDGRARMKLDLSQPLEIGLAILHCQKWRGVSRKPALAGLSCIAKSPNDRNPCHLHLFGLFCHVSRKHMGERVNSYRF